jgi:pseudouridine-5'-phosphate glycosidase
MMAKKWQVKDEVRQALERGMPVLAFESTVISHGLPYPQSVELALSLEQIAREQGCIPATIGIIEGSICVGLTEDQIDKLAAAEDLDKAAAFDIAAVVGRERSAGTTVSGTLAIAERAGIDVFATGGTGGVHRNVTVHLDISHDLQYLAGAKTMCVSAGAKAILDLPKTLEYMETAGVCVIGYQTDKFPAFYYRDSGLKLNQSVEGPEEAARIYLARQELQLESGMLVVVPVPKEKELPLEVVNPVIEQAIRKAEKDGITGKGLTPFLLDYLARTTDGQTVETNLALLKNNARVGAEIAVAIANEKKKD